MLNQSSCSSYCVMTTLSPCLVASVKCYESVWRATGLARDCLRAEIVEKTTIVVGARMIDGAHKGTKGSLFSTRGFLLGATTTTTLLLVAKECADLDVDVDVSLAPTWNGASQIESVSFKFGLSHLLEAG